MAAEVQMSEYKPRFVYSSRKRSAVRRITPAGWLTLAVVAAVVLLGSALVVNAVKGSMESHSWGGASQPESVAAVAPAKAGARATATPHAIEMTATPTPEGWVWWVDAMQQTEDNGLVPHHEVQREITIMWETYWMQMAAPPREQAALTAEEYAERYAMTYEFAEGAIANTLFEQRLATGKQITVTGAAINLRSGPGTTHDIIGQAQTHDTLLLLDDDTDDSGQLWYRAWDIAETREVWIASWLVDVKDNHWIFPQYEQHDVVVHDCAADGLECWVTDWMRDGGTGYYNLVTGETGFTTEGRYPATGIWAQGRMIHDSERGWICSGINWGRLDELSNQE
jgi:hypothetical protein